MFKNRVGPAREPLADDFSGHWLRRQHHLKQPLRRVAQFRRESTAPPRWAPEFQIYRWRQNDALASAARARGQAMQQRRPDATRLHDERSIADESRDKAENRTQHQKVQRPQEQID